jgi:hypothetical protein
LSFGFKEMNAYQSTTYSLTHDDLKAFTQRVLALAKARQIANPKYYLAIAWFGLVAIFLFMFRFVGDNLTITNIVPGSLVAAVVLSTFIFSLMRNARLMKPSESGFILGERTLTLGDNGFEVQGHHYDQRWDWSGVILIDETEHHLFLFLDNSAAHIIPRRIFSSSDHYKAFHDRIVYLHGQGSYVAQHAPPAAHRRRWP